MAELSPDCRELLAGPNFAHLATLMRDGSPHTVPVWIGVEGHRLLFFREEGSIGLRNLRRDPRVAISAIDLQNPYRYCAIRGTVVEERGAPAAHEWLDRLAVAYTGKRYPAPQPGVVVVVEPEHVAHARIQGFTHAPSGGVGGGKGTATGSEQIRGAVP